MYKASVVILLSLLTVSCNSGGAQVSQSGAANVDISNALLVDLSHPYDASTIFWPTEDGFQLVKEQDGINDKGYYYASNKFTTAEHGGTHIDAPRHFAQGHETVDQIPLDQLVGQAVVVDVTAKCSQNPDYQVAASDFQDWEKQNGEIALHSIVLIRTGFGKRWPDRKTYLGTDEHGAQAVAKLHFPGLGPDGAKWLVDNRSIKAVGLDTASIDYGQSTMFETHRLLFSHDVPAFENLMNLDQLPAKGFSIIAFPMKIGGGSGGPLRAVAVLKK